MVLLLAGVGMGARLQAVTDPATVPPLIIPDRVELHSGDILVVGGVSLQSRSVMALAGGQRYSHIGMIDIGPDGVFVIHASPRGAGDGGLGERVARLPLGTFLSERGYVQATVLRLNPNQPGAAARLADAVAIARGESAAATPFDHRYDLAEPGSLYCSELVWLAYGGADRDWPEALYTRSALTRADGPVILPGSFLDAKDFEPIWQSK